MASIDLYNVPGFVVDTSKMIGLLSLEPLPKFSYVALNDKSYCVQKSDLIQFTFDLHSKVITASATVGYLSIGVKPHVIFNKMGFMNHQHFMKAVFTGQPTEANLWKKRFYFNNFYESNLFY